MNPSDYKVLLVDDNTMTLNLMSNMLRAQGITKYETSMHGHDAMEKIKVRMELGNPYNIVFLDWNMPDISGYDVLLHCRQDPKNDKTAIVMLTAENQKRYVLEAIKAGATSYIVKPLSQDDLSKKMKQISEWIDTKVQG